jgi:hypothetical protein
LWKVTDALFPFWSTPVSKLPLLAVAVWALGPLLVQTIVSPTWMVMEPGLNRKSAIVTPGSPERRAAELAACLLAVDLPA